MDSRTLPNWWAEARLEDLGFLVSGQSPSSSDVNTLGVGAPYVSGPEHWDGTKVHLTRWTTGPAKIVPANSTFIVVKGTGAGKVFPGVSAAIGRDLAAFVPADPRMGQFLLLALRLASSALALEARGQIPGLKRTDILGLKVPVPPLDEQRRLVAILLDVENRLDKVHAVVELGVRTTSVLRQRTVADGLMGALTADWRPLGGRKEATAMQAVGLGSPSQESLSPEDWEWVRLADVTEMRTGHTPSRRRSDYWDGDIPWLGIPDASQNDGSTVLDTSRHITDAGLANSSAEVLPTGTVCLCRTAASIGYVVKLGVPMTTSQDFVNWICGPLVDPDWLLWFLREHRSILKSFGKGSTHKTIYLAELRELHVLLPPLQEQQEILRRVKRRQGSLGQLSELLALADAGAAELRGTARRLAMAGRFSAELEDDTAAASLLERVKATVQAGPPKIVKQGHADQRPKRPLREELRSAVAASPKGITPEDAFAAAGYNPGNVDGFFADLRSLIGSETLIYSSDDGLIARST